jgi:hypothetical protein
MLLSTYKLSLPMGETLTFPGENSSETCPENATYFAGSQSNDGMAEWRCWTESRDGSLTVCSRKSFISSPGL